MTESAGPPSACPSEIPSRRDEILGAAYHVLVEQGFARLTMLAVARRARASKETVYAQFGSREKLFEALIAWRADRMRAALPAAVEAAAADGITTEATTAEATTAETTAGGAGTPPTAVLTAFARDLLSQMTAASTIAIYRLAIAEAERFPILGETLDHAGRLPVRTSLIAYLEAARSRGWFRFDNAEEVSGLFVTTVLGDWPLRLLLGRAAPPDPATVDRRAAAAVALITRLYGSCPDGQPIQGP